VETEEPKNEESIKKALLKAINELPIEQQQAIRLFYVEEYSLKEIGDLLNISVGTVKSRLFHAREKLKVQFKNRNYEN
jgi:RNA polymerase sigma-70 factor (ECF subfamily)